MLCIWWAPWFCQQRRTSLSRHNSTRRLQKYNPPQNLCYSCRHDLSNSLQHAAWPSPQPSCHAIPVLTEFWNRSVFLVLAFCQQITRGTLWSGCRVHTILKLGITVSMGESWEGNKHTVNYIPPYYRMVATTSYYYCYCHILWPLYRKTCVSRHPQLRTGGFCWSKVLLTICSCWQQLVHLNYGDDARVLHNGVTCTVCVPSAPSL